MDKIWEYIKQFPVERAIIIICLFAACVLVSKLILVFLDKFMKKAKWDPMVSKIVRIAVKTVLLFTIFIIVLSYMGISVSSLLATLSVVGVAFSLAIQGFLSNVFGGIQIISNKPFKIGDYVEAGGSAGTVREVGLFYTKLDTPDKKLIQIPNSQIANESIINYSNATRRRIEFLVSVSYDNDADEVRRVLVELLSKHPMVIVNEPDIAPVAHVKEFKDSDICYTARAWCENSNYWTVYFDIMDSIKGEFEKKGITFSYPNVNVYMQPNKPE